MCYKNIGDSIIKDCRDICSAITYLENERKYKVMQHIRREARKWLQRKRYDVLTKLLNTKKLTKTFIYIYI